MIGKTIDCNIFHRLPNGLRFIAEQFTERKRERDVALLSSLTVLSNCFPNVSGIYDGKVVYPHLYAVIIAPAASGKGVMNYSRQLIEPVHYKVLADSKSSYDDCAKPLKKNESDKHCPPIQAKIVPANISSSELYAYLSASDDGVLIMESEADTLTQMLGNDWSNYSDLLRKCFHHEPVSIARKEDRAFFEVKKPKMSLLLSGTPEQAKRLIHSKENGLFSRLMIYGFEEVSKEFKSVFESKLTDIDDVFNSIGSMIFDLYSKLYTLENPIMFHFTESQKWKFQETFSFIKQNIIEHHSQDFVSSLHRAGLIAYRIAMILTVLRNIDEIKEDTRELICSNVDFLIAISITKTILRHAQHTFDSLSSAIPTQDAEMLNKLSVHFTTQQALEIGKELEIPTRTIHSKLAQWKEKKIIKSVKKGHYTQL